MKPDVVSEPAPSAIYITCILDLEYITQWNRLPASLVQVHNLIKFKSMLRTVDLSFALLGKL